MLKLGKRKSEKDFFAEYINIIEDKSKPKFIKKGAINEVKVVNEIIELNPDILVCYGASLIKSELLLNSKINFLMFILVFLPTIGVVVRMCGR